MNRIIVHCTALACLGFATAAVAASLPEEILVCRTVSDPFERAACYDQAVDALQPSSEDQGKLATAEPSATPSATPNAEPLPTPAIAPRVSIAAETIPVGEATPGLEEAPVAASEPETATDSASQSPEIPDQDVAELKQQVADLEQQVTVLSTERGSEPVSSEDLFGKDESSSRSSIQKMFGLGEVAQIESTVTEMKRTADRKMILVLDNGQIWAQRDNSRLRLKAGDVVVIESARMGSFLLQKQTGSLSIRVKRIN